MRSVSFPPTPILLLVLLCAAATLAPPLAAAQDPATPGPAAAGRIAGAVTGDGGAPLPGVLVTARSVADTSRVVRAVTGADGRFRIADLPWGRYVLSVSLLGYRSRSSEVIELDAGRPAVDLGTIALEVAPIAVEGVDVVAERPPVVIEADRTVYDARAMPAATAGTATDVLRAVPELEVDVNDQVRLRGNQPVTIHINGRPTPLQGEQLAAFLRQLPGDRIARVEVMPNPSARHDPEGSGGIVNLVLAENADLGLSGTLGVNLSTRNQRFTNGRLNYQRGRITLFSGGGVSTFQSDNTHHDFRQNLVTDPVTSTEQSSTTRQRGLGGNLDWTAELRVGRQATLWSNAWMWLNASAGDGVAEYRIRDDVRAVIDHYDRLNETDWAYRSYNLGFGFKQVFRPQKEELTIDARVSRGGNDNETRQDRLFHVLAREPVDREPEHAWNDVEGGTGERSLQVDWFRPAGQGRVEAGARMWQRDNDNDNRLIRFDAPDAADPDLEVRSGYDYRERVVSGYATYRHPFGRLSAQAGLRAEHTATRFGSGVADASFDRRYTYLYPSVNLAYSFENGRTLRGTYSRRIARPHPFYLDPFVPATDPLNINVGNPDLEPSRTDAFSLDYSVTGRAGTVRVAPYYRRTTNTWERIRTVDADGVATTRWENGRSALAYGSSFTLSLRQTGRVGGSTTFSVYRDVRDGSNIADDYRRAAVLWSLGGNMSGKITESLTAQVFANHFPTQAILQGRASGYTFTSIALRQQVLGQKGNISIGISDPLNLFRFDSSTSDATHVQTSRSSFTSRMARIGFSYSFGRPPERQSRQPTGEQEQPGETIRVR